MTGLSVVCLLLLLVQTASVEGSCFFDHSYFDEVTGSNYCLVDGTKRIEKNEWYLTPECFNCSCGVDLMSCCGVGIRAGVMQLPNGYRVQLVPPCDFIIVPE